MVIELRFSHLFLLSLTILGFFLTSCGTSYETSRVKDYRLALVDGTPALKEEFRRLVEEFNDYAGITVLRFEDSVDNANSAILITKGLKARDGKVGWGQMLSNTKSDNPYVQMPGSRPKRVIEYSMRLDFDADYYLSRMGKFDETTQREKQKLFFHEVGHGLEMDHASQRSDMMYPDIGGEKSYDSFFDQVRSYMADQ